MQIKDNWSKALKETGFLYSLIISFIFFVIAMYTLYSASVYAESFSIPPARDLILDSLPVINMLFLWSIGHYSFLFLIFILPLICWPRKVPFIYTTAGLFILVKSFFTIITRVGAPSLRVDEIAFFGKMFFTQDLFPSGHVALPFLGYLLFDTKLIKITLLIISFIMAISVLGMHTHYSIDVFGAYFVAYGVYAFSSKFLKKLL